MSKITWRVGLVLYILKVPYKNIDIYNKNLKEIQTLIAKLTIFKKHAVLNLLLLATLLNFEN